MRGHYLTKPERIMKKALADAGIKVVSQFSIRCSFILDFAIPEKKICIEVDGEYWHKDRKGYDTMRDKILEREGWLTLRFPALEIKNNISECITEIKRAIAS